VEERAELDILSSIKEAMDLHQVEERGRTGYLVLNQRGNGLT
jgi:hypothetical protein